MNSLLEYYQRFKTEEIFLWEDENECFIRSHPKDGYFVKFPGSREAPASPMSAAVNRAIDGQREISRKQYEAGILPKD